MNGKGQSKQREILTSFGVTRGRGRRGDGVGTGWRDDERLRYRVKGLEETDGFRCARVANAIEILELRRKDDVLAEGGLVMSDGLYSTRDC